MKAAPDDPAPHLLQARTQLLLADGVAAEAEARRAESLGAPAFDTRHLLAEALLLQAKPEKALVAATGPSRFPGATSRMRGRAHEALGRPADAAQAYGEALRLAPGDHRLWIDVARFRLSTGERAGAIVAAEQALRIRPRDVDALVLRGTLIRTQFGLRAALPWFARAAAIDPTHLPARLEQAATHGDLGQTRAMLAATREALRIAPDAPQARYLQAVLAARARNFPLARRLFERVEGPAATQPGALLLGGVIDLETGNPEQAIGRLEALLEAQPGNAAARKLLGLARLRTGDAPGAIATLRPLEGEPIADAYALTLLGAAYANVGNGAVATRALDRAGAPGGGTGLLPADLDGALGTQAFAQARDIRWELANGSLWTGIAEARAVAATSPGAPDAQLIAGDAAMLVGNPAAATTAYRRAANIAFIEPAALRLIEALTAAGETAEARIVLALFLDQHPRSLAALRLLGNLRLAASDWPGAIVMYDRVRAATGDHDAVLLNNLAWARYESGDVAGGLAHAARANSLAPGNIATADARGWMLVKAGRERGTGLTLLQQAWLAR